MKADCSPTFIRVDRGHKRAPAPPDRGGPPQSLLAHSWRAVGGRDLHRRHALLHSRRATPPRPCPPPRPPGHYPAPIHRGFGDPSSPLPAAPVSLRHPWRVVPLGFPRICKAVAGLLNPRNPI